MSDKPHHEGRHGLWHTLLDKATLRLRAMRHRRRRIRLFVVLALTALLVGGYLFMTSDRQVERLVEEYLENLFGTDVHIRSAHFGILSGLELESIRVVLDDPARPVFQAERMRITHDPLALLIGRLKVSELLAIGPRISLEQRDGHWNYERLFPEKRAPTAQRPVIYVEDGVLSVRQVRPDGSVSEHELQLSGVVQPDAARPQLLDFFASELETGGVRGHINRGTIDIANRLVRFEGRATNVALSEEVAATLPPEAREVWRRLAPQGMVSLKVVFGDRPDPVGQAGFRVEVDLNGVSMAYRHRDRTFRLQDLTGHCIVEPDELTLRNVHGVLSAAPSEKADAAEDGSELSVAVSLGGKIAGFGGERLVPELSVGVEDLDVGRVRPLVEDLWAGGEDFYRGFQPTGRVDLDLVVTREPRADALLQAEGEIRVKGVRAVPWWFPYPAEDITGTVRVAPRRIEVVDLKGSHGAARFAVRGLLDHMGLETETVNLTVTAQGVPIDDEVRSALTERFPSQVPVYDSLSPAGRADATVVVGRPPGLAQPIHAVVTVELRGTEMTYDAFPYRLTDGHGTVTIAARRTDVNVTGRHGPARLAIVGSICAGDEAGPDLDLDITGADVPLDDDLAAALPEVQRSVYQQYHLSGRADMKLKVLRDESTDRQVTHRATIDLKDVRMVFEEFPFPVEGIAGRMELSPGRFVVKDIHGTNADAAISASGSVEHSGDSYCVDLTIRGRNVLLDRDLRGDIGLVAPRLWESLSPEGRVDVVCRLEQPAEDEGPLRIRVALDARDVAVVYRHFPYPLRHCRGRLVYDGSRVTIENFGNAEGATRIRVSGTVQMPADGSVRSDLSIKASGLEIDERLIDALPGDFAAALRALNARGSMNVHIDRLIYEHGADGGVRARWRGSAVVDNMALDVGVPVDRVVAYVELEGTLDDAGAGLRATIDMPQGRIDGKEITDLHAELVQEPGSPIISVTRLEGRCYGGRIELDNEGRLVLGDQAQYGLNLLIQDVDFERFVHEGMGIDVPVDGGRLSGDFALWGRGADSEDIRARARFYVEGAKLYRLPLVVRVLNVLQLRGGNESFEEADVSMIVQRGAYVFEEIVLRGKGLAVHGAGRLGADGQLDLVFTTGTGRDESGPLGVLTQLVEGLRREAILVEVTGTTHDPHVEQRSFTSLTAPLRELLDAVEAGRRFREERERQRERIRRERQDREAP